MIGKKRAVTPERVIEILHQHGTEVTLEEAKLILDFGYRLCILSVKQVVREKSNNNGNR